MGIWILAYALCMIGERITGKLTSVNMVGENKASYYLYYTTHSLIACLFFFCIGKFNIQITYLTLLYSLAYGFSVLLSLAVGMLSLRYMNVLGSGILSVPFVMMLTAASGVIFWKEEITLSKYIAISLTSISAILIFLDLHLMSKKQKNAKEADTRVNLKAYIPLMIASVILTALQNVLLKAFAGADNVTDENSFYFLTNFTILAWALLMLLATSFKEKEKLKIGFFSFLKPRRLMPTAIRVILSNVMALALIQILVRMDISTFTPLSSAFSVAVGVFVSLIFKEKLGILSCISAVIAIVALFV